MNNMNEDDIILEPLTDDELRDIFLEVNEEYKDGYNKGTTDEHERIKRAFNKILKQQDIPAEFKETFRKHFWDILA